MLRGAMYLGADEVVTHIAKVLEVDKSRLTSSLHIYVHIYSWSHAATAIQNIESEREGGSRLTDKEVRLVVAAIVAVILMRNWHRPGVAANMTLDEFNNSSTAVDGGGQANDTHSDRHTTDRQIHWSQAFIQPSRQPQAAVRLG